ncbi:MAG: DUF4118 domain-containing protein [Erythrobacter sp.]|nr:MAG: DUF4118 domain-containing protein [Erythrobacter sp.]
MYRLATFDVGRRFVAPRVRIAMQCLFGLGCTLAVIGLRSLLDVWAPSAGPFSLIYPAILIAALYGHWQAGVVAYASSLLWAWYFVLPLQYSFIFLEAGGAARVAMNAISGLVVLLFAEAFRRAVVRAIEQRDEEIARRQLLQQELEHRTRNNFALAASLLETQKRREKSPEVAGALDLAITRIHSFASAYANLAHSQGEGAVISMRDYLVEVVDRVARGAFRENVTVDVEIGGNTRTMPREVAVAIGLFTNEALTNCAKYAFPDGRDGKVKVRFDGDQHEWTLAIADDGVGTADAVPSSGLGERLMVAFAQQARAAYRVEAGVTGRSLVLSSLAAT